MPGFGLFIKKNENISTLFYFKKKKYFHSEYAFLMFLEMNNYFDLEGEVLISLHSSPCALCLVKIEDYLRKYPNLSISIYFHFIYKVNKESTYLFKNKNIFEGSFANICLNNEYNSNDLFNGCVSIEYMKNLKTLPNKRLYLYKYDNTFQQYLLIN